MMRYNKLDIFHVKICKINYNDILNSIEETFNRRREQIITYANIHTLNLASINLIFRDILKNFNIIHPDGIGVFLASRFLYGKNGFAKRITGSDFYVELIKKSIINNWSFFFFGDTDETLSKISQTSVGLNIKGFCNGFNFNNDELIKNVNTSKPDILIVGLGSPKQEEWIIENKDKLHTNVIISVGEGIKVFAGTKKRGYKVIQKLGFEWLVRLFHEPKRLWKRYLFGIPTFIFRITKYKFMYSKKGM